MKCNKIAVLLSAYIDGELTGEEKGLLESHLGECPGCRTKYERLKQSDSLLVAASAAVPAPQFFETRLYERIKSRETESRSLLELIVIERRLLLAFAGLFFIVSVVALNLNENKDYKELKSYVLGNSAEVVYSSLTAGQAAEVNDMVSYLMSSNS